MSKFSMGLVFAGVLAGWMASVNLAAAQAPPPETLSVTAADLRKSVANNEAALDSQLASRLIEIRGTAEKIIRTETGDYVLQFLPDLPTDNFVRLQINFEFPRQDRDTLGNLKLPVNLTIRGTMKHSNWQPKYDNHRHYNMVIRNSQIIEAHPTTDFR